MFYRHKDLQEGYVHQCSDANKYIIEHRREMAKVQKHDCSTFLRLENGIVRIKFCPYCGVELANDTETQKFLNIKL